MPLSDFWTIAAASSVFLSVAFALSTRYNTRRLEDSSYGIWTAILLKLCRYNLDIFVMCPQYGLFKSSNESNDPDASFISTATIPDKAARGVVLDNCLILPEVEFRNWRITQTISEYFRKILDRSPHSPQGDLRVGEAKVPVIVEQKRPPPRHQDITTHGVQLTTLLQNASRQAQQQCLCLFSMPKFASQDEAILIATSGAWWRFRFARRSDWRGLKAFDLVKYMDDIENAMQEEDEQMPESDSDDQDNVLVAPDDAVAEAQEIAKKNEGSEGRVLRSRVVPAQPEPLVEKNAELKQQWEDLLQQAGQGPFTADQLDRWARLKYRKAQTEQKKYFCQPYVPKVLVASDLDGMWTHPMRIGTAVSDQYMAFIQRYLDDLSIAEKERRRTAVAKQGVPAVVKPSHD